MRSSSHGKRRVSQGQEQKVGSWGAILENAYYPRDVSYGEETMQKHRGADLQGVFGKRLVTQEGVCRRRCRVVAVGGGNGRWLGRGR